MPSISTEANRFYPSVPAVDEEIETHTAALMVIRESVETHERRNNNYLKSFIRFEELIDLGIINEDGDLTLAFSASLGGDVTKVGTPVNNELAVWTGDGTVEGEANLVYSSTQFDVTVGSGGLNVYSASGAEILLLQDTGGAGNAADPHLALRDSAGTRLGYMGIGSAANSHMVFFADSGNIRLIASGTIELEDATNVTGALTATSFGGITSANLLDKSASETITGAYIMNGSVNFQDSNVYRPKLNDYAVTRQTVTVAATTTVSYINGQMVTLDLQPASITTLNLNNPPASGQYGEMTIELIQGSTARTVAWPSSLNWPGGTAPVLTTTNNAKDIIHIWTRNGGTDWHGTFVLDSK